MTTLEQLTKVLDALDPNALTEDGVVKWAQEQIVEAKGDPAHLQHVRGQIDAAQTAFAKGASAFRVKAYAPDHQAQTPLQAASAKLGALLGKTDGTETATDETSTDAATKTDEADGETDANAQTKPDGKVAEASKGGKPTRKAAPAEVGKGYFEADDDSVWGSPLGASMSKVKIGDDGKVYTRH